ncbi:hypothetical protein PPERSA_05877 [Pseudocohnilembus persalinus]|uniref:Uncharacterized protein n=1 Tax=Pseudocohnilembus persalinus TaxID=266149 RepID=A0A0V0R4R7_PSEPJ|nr:hypothetical protein PPERSA_05877 [Pseudocohnilembus persalinus]|eukprot:KRX09208.1 hypothetical protein PPERSA_05877 [Pseudocohnilembus persalinus]
MLRQINLFKKVLIKINKNKSYKSSNHRQHCDYCQKVNPKRLQDCPLYKKELQQIRREGAQKSRDNQRNSQNQIESGYKKLRLIVSQQQQFIKQYNQICSECLNFIPNQVQNNDLRMKILQLQDETQTLIPSYDQIIQEPLNQLQEIQLYNTDQDQNQEQNSFTYQRVQQNPGYFPNFQGNKIMNVLFITLFILQCFQIGGFISFQDESCTDPHQGPGYGVNNKYSELFQQYMEGSVSFLSQDIQNVSIDINDIDAQGQQIEIQKNSVVMKSKQYDNLGELNLQDWSEYENDDKPQLINTGDYLFVNFIQQLYNKRESIQQQQIQDKMNKGQNKEENENDDSEEPRFGARHPDNASHNHNHSQPNEKNSEKIQNKNTEEAQNDQTKNKVQKVENNQKDKKILEDQQQSNSYGYFQEQFQDVQDNDVFQNENPKKQQGNFRV